MTESKAEINAGLIIVTGHMPVQSDDVEMTQEHATPDRVQHADTTAAADQTANPDAGWRHTSTQVTLYCKSCQQQNPGGMAVELRKSRANFLATSAVPEDPADALRGGLLLTPLMGCKARTPLA